MNKFSDEEIDIVARTIYGEARGEYLRSDSGLAGLIAIANVINNRAKLSTRYGRTLKEVCLKPYQFSCWNSNDSNRSIIMTVDDKRDVIFQKCQEVALKTITEQWPDLTSGSNHYYAVWLPIAPSWAQGRRPTVKIGCHVFFNID